MSSRLERLAAELEEPLLVTTPINVFYLCGFESTNAALLVERDRVRLFTDFRYVEAARAVPDVEPVETKRDVFGSLPGILEGRIGFEADHVTYAHWEVLREGSVELVPRSGLVERLRAVKDERELAAIREAAELATRALERLLEQPWTGRSESDLARELERLLREEGADGVSFPSIVASGPNGARPHAGAGGRPLEPGELVTVDWGAELDGYHSDCTRTFAVGKLDQDLHEIYHVCLEAQRDAVPAVRAGAHGHDVDKVARDRIAAAGYGEAFGHGLGHGVGLEVHEAPVLRPESEDTLEPGNVVTVEPGIYLPGRGGVRIEDLLVVTESAPEVLTTFPKELRTVA